MEVYFGRSIHQLCNQTLIYFIVATYNCGIWNCGKRYLTAVRIEINWQLTLHRLWIK